ncbi:MAG: hypothetical protein ACREN4_06430 [Candidatus Dormibacteria bacterium]
MDAIPAAQLRQLVEAAITRHIDPEALRINEVAERSEREILSGFMDQLPGVAS